MKMKWTTNSQRSFIIILISFSYVVLVSTQTQSQPSLASSTLASNTNITATTQATTSATTTTTTSASVTTSHDIDQPTTTATTEEPEPVTSTTDSLSVNANDPETSTGAENESTGDDGAAPGETGEGLEGRSISAGGSSRANGLDDTNAKLTILQEDGDATAINSTTLGAANTIINMTQIDEIYVQGRKEEEEIVENWQKLGKKFKKGLSGLIGSMVPYALNMSQEAKISSNCSGAMLKWILSMNQLKSWALKMLDASGKPIAGLLEGSMTMFGNYRQCLKIRAPDDDEIEFSGGEFREYFRGKYCVIQAKPWLPQKGRFYNLNAKLKSLQTEETEENAWYDKTIFDELSEWILAFNYVDIRYDLCVPSMCSREDIQKTIAYLLKGIDFKARVLRCETDGPIGSTGFTMAAQVESGSSVIAEALSAATPTKATNISTIEELEHFSQLGWIFIPMIAVVLVLIATALSMGMGEGSDNQLLLSDQKKTKLRRAISALSLRRSVESHLDIDYDQLADDKPLALYGVRFMLVLWVVLVEAAVNLKFEYLRELMMLKDLIFLWPMQFIINSTMQYDSIILLTAFTMAYKNCLNDGTNNAKTLTKFVIDKFVRLMPSVMVMVALVILLPLVYRGPVWNDYVTKQSAVCQSTGWVNSIFLQNYLPYDNICLPQTWLLCVEFQLILLMAPIVYYLNKSYTFNYGGRRNLALQNGSLKRADLLTTTTPRSEDSSKLGYWFFTLPGNLLMGCIVAGTAASFYNVYYNQLPPSWFYTMVDPDSKALYFGGHMTKIWTHVAVFALGILAGVECRRATKNIYRSYRGANMGAYMSHIGPLSKHHKSQSSSASSLPSQATSVGNTRTSPSTLDQNSCSNVSILINSNGSNENINRSDDGMTNPSSYGANGSDIGIYSKSDDSNLNNEAHRRSWLSIIMHIIGSLIALRVMMYVIFSTYDWSMSELPEPMIAGLYDAGGRLFWSLAMIWILYLISVPNKDRTYSLLARALGHPLMVSLGRLSFLIYIIYPFVHTTVLAIQEQPIYSSWLMMFHILIGNITITAILASMVSLFVEMPCRNLFRRCGTSLLLTQSTIDTTTGGPTGRGLTCDTNSAASSTTTSAATATAAAAATTTTTTSTSMARGVN